MVDGAFIDDVEKRVISYQDIYILCKNLLLPTAQKFLLPPNFSTTITFSKEKHIPRY